MNKKVLSLIMVLFSVILLGKAQETSRIKIKGTVTDASTGEPVPFANLGVVGTLAGVASDMDGAFELLLPGAYADKKLRVSVVGYAPYDIKVTDAAAKEEGWKIALQPVTYAIQQVNVCKCPIAGLQKDVEAGGGEHRQELFCKPLQLPGIFPVPGFR